MIKYANTKLGKTFHLKGNEELIIYIPRTEIASRENVHDMLRQFGMVYVKPNLGTGGHGVMKAERIKGGSRDGYRYKLGLRTYAFSTFDAFYSSLSKNFGGRRYLVQQGIRMLTYKQRPFDIRIMVQKNSDRVWEHTGTIGRLAHPKRAVTNYHSGGTPLSIDKLLKPHAADKRRGELAKKLGALGLQVAAHMQSGYPGVKELGVDVGMDKALKPWIFEVNTRPDPFIFKKLNRPEVYRRILQLTKLNGRFRFKRKKLK